MKILIALASLVPGIGHILAGRCARGLFFFVPFLFFLNQAFLGRLFWDDPPAGGVVTACRWCAAIVWGYAQVDIWRILFWKGTASLRKRKQEQLRTALDHAEKEQLDEAIHLLRQVLKLDREDADAYFHMGLLHRRQGKLDRARRYFRKCRVYDLDNKWTWRVGEEVKAIHAGGQG